MIGPAASKLTIRSPESHSLTAGTGFLKPPRTIITGS
jgi:hypothetical protein